jgi:hypothetical protein
MNNTGSTSLLTRPEVGQANIETNFVTVKRNGGPLSQFLPSDTDTTTLDPNPLAKAKISTPALAAVVTNDKKENVMSSADNNSPVLYPNQIDPERKTLSTSPLSNPFRSESTHTPTKEFVHTSTKWPVEVKDPEAELQIDIEDIDYHMYRHVHTPPEVEEAPAQERIDKSQPSAPDPEDPSIEIDWDSDETWQRRFFRTIMDERKQRQEERQELEGERQQIAQIRRNIDQQKYDLEVRENKLIELEPFIPLAKQLQAMKIDITNFLPWEDTYRY